MDFITACYSVLAWLGMLMFSIFGGMGLVVLPIDLLSEFIYRPKPIQAAEFKKRVKVLLPIAEKLRKEGKRLDEDRSLVLDIRGITGFYKRY